MSGAKAARPGLARVLEVARVGDVLTVWRLDRLGRSLHDLILLAKRLEESGIGLISPQEKIDTSSSGGMLVFQTFGALAEFERNLVRERTQAGLMAARARGRKGGRPKVLEPAKRQLAVKLYNETRHMIGEICRMMGLSKSTLLQLPGRSWRLKCGAGGPSTRRWWRCAQGSRICRRVRRNDKHRCGAAPIRTGSRSLRCIGHYGSSSGQRALHHRDRGCPRKLSRQDMERIYELIAGMKLRTTKREEPPPGGSSSCRSRTGSKPQVAWSGRCLGCSLGPR